MATEIIMPTLGETMDEGTIARWRVADGDKVNKGQVIAEIESNKAVFELEATAAGVLHIIAPEGKAVPILSLIGHILAPGESVPGAPATAEAKPAARAAAPEAAAQTAAAPAPAAAPVVAGRQFVSPRARRTASEKGIDVSQVPGSGPNGRVEERDVLAYLASQPRLTPLARKMAAEAGVAVTAEPHARVTRADVEAQAVQKAAPVPAPAPAATAPGEVTVAPMGIVRRVIAQKMGESAHTTASVTLTTEVDATELVHLRDQIKEHVQKATGQSLSYNVLLARLVAMALRELPYMNSRLVGNEIHTPAAQNVGIAVDTERGLLVPVLRDVANKSLLTLTREAAALFTKATSGGISADEMAGGTFTITNLGIYGIDAFSPIINLPECAILGVGRIAPRPAVWQGQIAVRQMVVLSLTFDHRLVDGAPAARFLQRVAQLVENPYPLLVE